MSETDSVRALCIQMIFFAFSDFGLLLKPNEVVALEYCSGINSIDKAFDMPHVRESAAVKRMKR